MQFRQSLKNCLFHNRFGSQYKIVFYRLVLIIAILFSGNNTIAFANNDHPHHRILQSASELDYPPFALMRRDGRADGFSVDLLKAVTEAANLEVNISVGLWHEIKQLLAEGHLDVLPLVAYSEERADVYDFTVPYLEMHGTIFVRKGEKSIQSQADLKNREVLVMRGDSSHEYAVREKVSNKLILTDTFADAMRLLSQGKHDAVFCQYVMGLQLIKKLGIANIVSVSTELEKSLKPTGKPVSGFGQKFCIAVREGDKELLALMNEGLAIVYANGTYENLYNKWFGPILPKPPIPITLVLIYALSIIVPALFILGLFGIWFMKKEVQQKTISLQREVRDKLKAEEKFKDFMMSANDGFVLYDAELNLQEINDKALEMFPPSSTRENLYGKSILDVSPDLKETGRYQKYLDVKNTGKPFHLDEFIPDTSFGKRYLSLNVFKVGDGLGIIFSDITARKQMEDALQESEARFRSMMHQSPAVIELYDVNGVQIEVNQAYEVLWGFPASQTVGTFNVLKSKEVEKTGLIDYVQRAYGGEAVTVPVYEFDPRGETEAKGTGRLRWLSTRIYPLKDTAGNVKHIVITHEDISEVKYGEEEKEKLKSHLQQAQKMEAIGTLAGGIAHDFNNILGAILGYTEMAREDIPEDSSVAKDLDKVLEAGYRAKGLVKQILAFSRQDNTDCILFQPASLIKETIKMLRPTLPSSIEIVQNINPATGLIFADPTQFNQILMNLCTNAFHAMEETGGRLNISLKETNLSSEDLIHESTVNAGTFVRLSVHDTGKGIAAEIQDKIFNPYFTTKETGKGTGMGLSIVHGIVKSYGGFISLHSEPGEDTTFNIFLPAIENKVLPEKESVEPIPRGRESILFVDDEELLVNMGKDMLERLGYHVTARKSSFEALETFEDQPDQFDLVITDQTMPGMTGGDLARRMIQIRPDIPIILCTGFSTILSEKKAKAIGIREFILKPLSKKSIAMLIRKVLDAA